MSRPQFVVVGEALVDVVRRADTVDELPGGSPANVAVTLARLGRSSTLVTTLADDARGRMVRAWAEAAGVRIVAAPPAGGRTSTAVATIAADGSATYDFDLEWDLSTEALTGAIADGCDVLHTGSIATVLAPGGAAVEAALIAASGRALVSFDPNARPSVTPRADDVRPAVERLVGLCDVVKASAEDLAWYYPGADPVASLRTWAQAGPVLAVVTLGAEGGVLVRGKEVVSVPGRAVRVADTIGAGDTFTGAFLDALASAGAAGPQARAALAALPTERLVDAAAWATAAAAVTVSRPGANPPRRDEIPWPASTTCHAGLPAAPPSAR